MRLQESGKPATELSPSPIGVSQCQEGATHGARHGADRAILRSKPMPCSNPWMVAKLLEALVEREQSDLVILGKQAIDDDCNQTGQMLAALLGWAAGHLRLQAHTGRAGNRGHPQIDGGLETVALKLPAVVTADLRLNEPLRQAAQHNEGQKKPLETLNSGDLRRAGDTTDHASRWPNHPKREAGINWPTSPELVAKLKKRRQARI